MIVGYYRGFTISIDSGGILYAAKLFHVYFHSDSVDKLKEIIDSYLV